jgi:hypothetical protein
MNQNAGSRRSLGGLAVTAANCAFTALIAAAIVGVTHEFGHFLAGWCLGWQPSMSFARGGSVAFSAQPPAPVVGLELATLAAGPVMTFSLAGAFVWVSRRQPRVLFFAIFALWNAVFRFSVLIDGKGSDEAKMSALIGSPFVFEALSVVVSLILSVLVIRSQRFYPRRTWLIPLAFVVFAVCYIASLRVMAYLFG